MSQPLDPRGLESLFDLGDPAQDWSDSDLAAMLRHLLDGPAGDQSGSIRSLLSDPSPSIESLEVLKRLAKSQRANPGHVPPDLWRVVYFAAIARAALAGESISELSADDLRAGYRWTLARTWLDADVRGLIESVARAASP